MYTYVCVCTCVLPYLPKLKAEYDCNIICGPLKKNDFFCIDFRIHNFMYVCVVSTFFKSEECKLHLVFESISFLH